MFVLNVDLWSPEGSRPVNLVRHTPTSPSIPGSAAVPQGFGEAPPPSYPSNTPSHLTLHDIKYNSGAPSYNQYPGGPAANPYAQQSQQPPYAAGGQYGTPGYAPTTNGSQQYPQNGFNQPQSSY